VQDETGGQVSLSLHLYISLYTHTQTYIEVVLGLEEETGGQVSLSLHLYISTHTHTDM